MAFKWMEKTVQNLGLLDHLTVHFGMQRYRQDLDGGYVCYTYRIRANRGFY